MLIASWNVNSIRSRIEQVIDWLNIIKPDVLCLQETKVIDQEFPYEPFKNIGYEVKVYGQKAYNGVAIISKNKFEDVKFGFEGELVEDETPEELINQKRIISAFINGVRIINLYVPNGSSIPSDKFTYKLQWLKHLKRYLIAQEKRNESTIILGDFNIAPKDQDIHTPEKFKNKIMASQLERELLKDIIEDRFLDSFRVFENRSGFYSWWDYRNNAYNFNKGWRIDHIYICKKILSKLKSSVIDSSQRENNKPSDHAPVMIDLNLDETSNVFDYEDEDFFEL